MTFLARAAPDAEAEVYDVMMIAFCQDAAKLESEDNFSLQRVA